MTMTRRRLLHGIGPTIAPLRRLIGLAFSTLLVLADVLLAARPARADVILVVDTATDTIANDGLCSLREAITAANDNARYFGCLGNGGGFDLIEFALGSGTPVIQITSALPTITGPVEINGGPGRVELRGPGGVDGLVVSGAGAAGSSIRNLVLDGFWTAVYVESTTEVVLAGNYIGTDATGSVASANAIGILLELASARIGGTSGWSPGGSCAGECNLISGNTFRGIHLRMGSSAVIQGNLIGTNATGSAAIGNPIGVYVENSVGTIGGSTPGSGNLVSGNVDGIQIQRSSDLATATVIQGNRIGTDTSGSAAIANTTGIRVSLGNSDHPVLIGGDTALARNLISGNAGAGIRLQLADLVTIQGNRIGTRADGLSALGNGGAGVELASSTHQNIVGGVDAGQGNTIAHNAIGVSVGIYDYHNVVRGNAISGNAGKGIALADDQMETAVTPTIVTVAPISGTACPGCVVDVYSDAADEGGTYEGSTTADGGGSWTFNGAVTGPNVTATATTAEGSTSEFSAAVPEPSLGVLLGAGVAGLAAAAFRGRVLRIQSPDERCCSMAPVEGESKSISHADG